MDLLTISIVAAVLLVIVGLGISYKQLKKRGVDAKDVIDEAEAILNVVYAVLDNFKIDTKLNNKISVVLSVIEVVIEFVSQLDDAATKADLAYNAVLGVLKELGVSIDDNIDSLIKSLLNESEKLGL